MKFCEQVYNNFYLHIAMHEYECSICCQMVSVCSSVCHNVVLYQNVIAYR